MDTKQIKTVQERDTNDLLVLTFELCGRATMQPNNKDMHDTYVEARTELEKRLAQSQHPVPEASQPAAVPDEAGEVFAEFISGRGWEYETARKLWFNSKFMVSTGKETSELYELYKSLHPSQPAGKQTEHGEELAILEKVLKYFNTLENGFPKELYEEVFQIVNEKVLLNINDVADKNIMLFNRLKKNNPIAQPAGNATEKIKEYLFNTANAGDNINADYLKQTLRFINDIAQPAAVPDEAGEVKAETFLQQLRRLSVERAINGFKTYDNQPITYWTTAVIGEFGELCNMIKKMKRAENGGHDSGHSYTAKSITPKMIREEVGGTLIYIDLLCSFLNIDLEEAIIETFNEKSIELGFHYLLDKSSIHTSQPAGNEAVRFAEWTSKESYHFYTHRMAWGKRNKFKHVWYTTIELYNGPYQEYLKTINT